MRAPHVSATGVRPILLRFLFWNPAAGPQLRRHRQKTAVRVRARLPRCLLLLVLASSAPAQGQLTFLQALNYPGSANGPMAVADFNLDGNLDMIDNGGEVLLGNGAGGFTETASLIGSSPFFVADFNGDGKPDALVSQSSFNLTVY